MKKQQGIVKTIILLVIALLILSYYGFDLRRTVESPTTQSNFGYVTTFVLNVWHNYLERPAKYLWNDVFINLIWNSAIENLNRIKAGQPDELQQHAPQLPQASATQ
jgi:hypothetical protein